MKKFILFILVFIIHYSLFINNCESQWSADTRLTFNPDSSWVPNNNSRCIASNNNYVFVFWTDKRDGNFEIYYRRSTDGGLNWEQDVRFTNNDSLSASATVAVSGNIVHVAWHDKRNGLSNSEVYYKRSTDNGLSWGDDIRLTNAPGNSSFPSIISSENYVHLVWTEIRDGNWEIYYKRSTDNGISWENDVRLTNNASTSYLPCISVSGPYIHVTWYDYRDGNTEIYYKRSTDNGINWENDVRLTNNSYFSLMPTISSSGQFVHIGWSDTRDGSYEVYYKNSTDNGTTWNIDRRLTFDSLIVSRSNVSIVAADSNLHIVWYNWKTGDPGEIFYKRSIDNGNTWESSSRLTYDTSASVSPQLSVSGPVVHVIWNDKRDGNLEVYYKRNPTGNPIGIKNIGSEIPADFQLYQNFPNPFNPTTKIRFDILSGLPLGAYGNDKVVLKIFDISGREIATLVNDQLQPGTYEVTFDGSKLSSGIYFYQLRTGNFTATKKLVLLK
jgi:hypothetical protein